MATPDYAALADVQQAFPDMQVGNEFSSTYNSFLTVLITRASRMFDEFTLRKPGAYAVNADVQYYFNGFDAFDLQAGSLTYKGLNIGELAAAPTTVEVSYSGRTADFTAFNTTDYFMYPYNALDLGEPYWGIVADFVNGTQYYWGWYPRCVRITGKFGYSLTVPDEIKQGIIIQAARWFKRGLQKYQDLTVFTDPNQHIYRTPDPEFHKLVDYFRRVSV